MNLETLGKDNINLQREIHSLRRKLNQQEEEFKKKETNVKAEFLANIEKVSPLITILLHICIILLKLFVQQFF